MKANRLVCLVVLLACPFLGGCKSTWDFWKQDAANTVKSNIRHFDRINESVHRHFLNYDWSDPYLD